MNTSKSVRGCNFCNSLDGVVANIVFDGSEKLGRVVPSRLRRNAIGGRVISFSSWERRKARVSIERWI